MFTFQELKKILRQTNRSNMPCLKIALLGDSATQLLTMAIDGIGCTRGYDLRLWEAEYNQIEHYILDSTSEFHDFSSDYTIVFQSTHKLLEKYNLLSNIQKEKLAEERLAFVRTLCDVVKGKVIYYNYPEINDAIFGNYANKLNSSFIYQLRKLNYELMNLAQEYRNLCICDVATLQNKFGRDIMFRAGMYVNTDMVFSIDALPYVASCTMDIICATEGKLKKCLILDLDNTLWGGVVGDDGWECIQIGHCLGIGKAFIEFQEWIKKLKNRGIILAICSKNNEDKAKEPFENNPEMVLKLEDITVFIANWENKVNNIYAIKNILNIGFDSMVFLDDNAFERDIVRKNIPNIVVPELPQDPSEYLEYLYSLNLFETASYSIEDTDRTRQYQVDNERTIFRKTFANESEYLESLNMVSVMKGFDSFNIPRVAQLSQRSNQFNLRTVRYTEEDILNLSKDDHYVCFSFTLSDKFGDNGLVSVIILKKENDESLFIDTWFMSCRVLKRGLENFAMNQIVKYAKDNDFKYVIGEYIPTSKNGIVKNLYSDLGFKLLSKDLNRFELIVCDYEMKKSNIQMK